MTTLKELASTEVSRFVNRRISIFKPEDTASKVLGELDKTDRYEALVSCDLKYGLITIRDLLDVEQPELTKLGEHSQGRWRILEPLAPQTPTADAVNCMINLKARAIPVVENDKPLGIISQVDVLNALCDAPELSKTSPLKLMQRPVTTLDAKENVATARRLMLDHGFSHVPITRNGSPVGMVTAKDIAHNFLAPLGVTTRGDRGGAKVPRFSASVGEIMDTGFLAVEHSASALDAVCRMRDQRKSACIVVDESRSILGILTPRDLIAVLFEQKEEELPIYIIGLTEKEDFFERAVAEEKIRRIVVNSMRMHPHITEVAVRIKRTRAEGNRSLYETTARVLSPTEQFIAKTDGWDLMAVFDELCDNLDRTLKEEKHTPRDRPQRLRRLGRK